MGGTLFDKIWDNHVVYQEENTAHGNPSLIYVDCHLIHEVTSPQAFAGLKQYRRKVRRPDLTFATMDHNVPTTDRSIPVIDGDSSLQMHALRNNCKEFDITLFDMLGPEQGIVHVIGPELGLTLPGMTICNMSIEGGARAGLIAPADITFDYIRGRAYAPSGEKLEKLIEYWQSSLITDAETCFDKSISMDLSNLAPQVSWGTNPSMVADVTGNIPYPEEFADGSVEQEKSAKRALEYMGLEPGIPITEINIDRVFIGSCTNARLEDLIDASRIIEGRTVSSRVNAMVVPGSQSVKRAAEERGIDQIFKKAGFEWRESGCSMCLGMNPDILAPKQRCASTSNRNFEGRQGLGGRTHLVSPIMAAAAAVEGKFVDVREWF